MESEDGVIRVKCAVCGCATELSDFCDFGFPARDCCHLALRQVTAAFKAALTASTVVRAGKQQTVGAAIGVIEKARNVRKAEMN